MREVTHGEAPRGVRRLGPGQIWQSPSAAGAATGLVEVNPVFTIMERRPEALPDIKAAVARNVAAELGDRPVRCHLQAHVFSARRPGSDFDFPIL